MEIFGNRVNQNKNILKYYVFSNKTKSIPMCDLSRKNDASAKMKKTIRSPIENGDLTNTTIYGGATDQPITTVIWDQQQGNLHQQQCGLKPGIGQNIVSKKAKKKSPVSNLTHMIRTRMSKTYSWTHQKSSGPCGTQRSSARCSLCHPSAKLEQDVERRC